MRDCLAYITREAEAFCLMGVANHLKAACEQLDRDIDNAIEDGPIDLVAILQRKSEN